MKIRKVAYTLLVLLIAITVLAASNYGTLVYGIKKGQTKSFTNGRAGISFVKSYYTGQVQLKRTGKSSLIPGEDKPSFIQKPLDVRFEDYNGDRVTHVLGAVYVFFLVRRSEVKKFDNGELAIVWFDTWKQEWVECDTFAVHNGADISRLGCRIRVYGLYGLAKRE